MLAYLRAGTPTNSETVLLLTPAELLYTYYFVAPVTDPLQFSLGNLFRPVFGNNAVTVIHGNKHFCSVF